MFVPIQMGTFIGTFSCDVILMGVACQAWIEELDLAYDRKRNTCRFEA